MGAAAPNLLLIIVDTLRADALSAMPEVQKFAQKGTRFDQAITAATWTRPALLALPVSYTHLDVYKRQG